jgi:hypothetical protein
MREIEKGAQTMNELVNPFDAAFTPGGTDPFALDLGSDATAPDPVAKPPPPMHPGNVKRPDGTPTCGGTPRAHTDIAPSRSGSKHRTGHDGAAKSRARQDGVSASATAHSIWKAISEKQNSKTEKAKKFLIFI